MAFYRNLKGLLALLLAGTILLATGCAPKAVEASGSGASSAPAGVLVEVARPETGSLTRSTEYIGRVEPDELVNVLPKSAGTVLRVHAQVGDEVQAGDLLFEIDPIDIELQLAAQKASVDAAKAGVLTAQAQVDQSLGSGFDLQLAQLETQVKSAQNQYAIARQGLRDYNDGKDDGVEKMEDQLNALRAALPALEGAAQDARNEYNISYKEWGNLPDGADKDAKWKEAERLRAISEVAQDKVSKTEENISLLRANVNDMDDEDASARSLRTQVKNAQLAYDSSNAIYELTKDDARNDALRVANAQLGQATASFEAQVKSYEAAAQQLEYTKVYAPIDGVIEGCSITENGMASQSQPAYTVSNKTAVTAVFYVSADAVYQMNPGDHVTVENGRSTYSGKLTEVGSMTDQASGLFKVKASIENGGDLMTGLAVKIVAETAKAQNSLLIPQDAIYYEEGKGYVYVNQGGKAVKTFIETGVSNNEMAEVLSGLSADNELVVSWNPNLMDGAPLEIAVPASESSSSAPAASEGSSSASAASEGSSSAPAASEGSSSAPTASEGSSSAPAAPENSTQEVSSK